jgi:hypothetical protein
VAKTWSPQGCTPIHYHRQRRRDKVSVISGISVSPRRQRLGLYYQLYFDNIGQEDHPGSLRLMHRRTHQPVSWGRGRSQAPDGIELFPPTRVRHRAPIRGTRVHAHSAPLPVHRRVSHTVRILLLMLDSPVPYPPGLNLIVITLQGDASSHNGAQATGRG